MLWPESEAVDVQLLGQVTSAEEWPKLLAYWERRNPSGVASWPRRLDPGDYALNLWPLPAGRVGSRGRTRRETFASASRKTMLCTPGLTGFNPDKETERRDDGFGGRLRDLA